MLWTDHADYVCAFLNTRISDPSIISYLPTPHVSFCYEEQERDLFDLSFRHMENTPVTVTLFVLSEFKKEHKVI